MQIAGAARATQSSDWEEARVAPLQQSGVIRRFSNISSPLKISRRRYMDA